MCFKGVRQFQNSEVTDHQEPFCVCIYYGITVVGLDRPGCGRVGGFVCNGQNRVKGQVVGGGFVCNGHNRVKGHVLGGGGGDHNHENYYGIDRPGCGGGFHM